MQSEYKSGVAMSNPVAATFGDDLTIGLASTVTTTMASDFCGQQVSDNSLYSLSNMAFLPPYSSVISPAMASSIEITSTSQSQASRRCLTSEQQDLINSHALCLSHLHNAAKEVSSLREENLKLCSINHRLSLIAHSYLKNPPVPVGGDGNDLGAAAAAVTAFDLANTYGRLSISENGVEKEGNSNQSPTSVMEGSEVDRMTLPKSISVRSNDLWKGATGQNPGEGKPTVTVGKGRVRAGCSSGARKQKVYVRGGKKEEAPVELEVYNQGMFKTELCNKWQETGACPYGDHCQFAHGIKELRPVIRHPRYKTEVCRMVLAGNVCPYGHRCHFRHSLTEQEKLASMTPLPTTGELDD
ncbi:hypothetical protein MLD38_030832 [Melastoma candidum]|uniref:Uncharacterized protein n=1 Tax=Melastoma candidum TaxID=119954 RepID=A0ACB9MMW6_9MYRT|nr:hypothetical protein MLD38_030832 [Melastoma candidum]